MLVHSLEVAGLSDPITDLVDEFEREWRQKVPCLDRFIARLPEEDRAYGRAELVRVDLQQRYNRGLRPSAREYFDRFPDLTDVDGRALSIIYEEYCLRKESQEDIEPSEFCKRYSTWQHSLVAQLAIHRHLSQAETPPPKSPPFPNEGEAFGEFALVELLGTGGASRVFVARAKQMGGMEVVLKITHDRGDESAIMGHLDHDHIVPINTSFVDEKTGFRVLSMPYRPGLTLDQVVNHLWKCATNNRPAPRKAQMIRELMYRAYPDQRSEEERSHGWKGFPSKRPYCDGVAWIGLKLASALAHAHSRGVFHRDVKPDNVLLSCRSGPQLIDFNLSHQDNPADQARAAHRGGTLPYMAREQLLAFQDSKLWATVGAPADLFSLGLILRELLTFRPTEKPDLNREVPRVINDLLLRRNIPVTSLRKQNPAVPHALDAIVQKMLAESLESRYKTCDEVAEDLQRFLNRRPLRFAKNPSRVERAKNWATRNSMRAAIAAVCLLVVGLATKPGRDVLRNVLGVSSTDQTAVATPKTLDEMLSAAIAALQQGKKADGDQLITQLIRQEGAEKFLEDYLRANPESFIATNALANLYQAKPVRNRAENLLRASQTEALFRRMIELDPNKPEHYYDAALMAFVQEKQDQALIDVDEAIRLNIAMGGGERQFFYYRLMYLRSKVHASLAERECERPNLELATREINQALADLAVVGPNRGAEENDDLTSAYPCYSTIEHVTLARLQLKSNQKEAALATLLKAQKFADDAEKVPNTRYKVPDKVKSSIEELLKQANQKN